MTTIRDIYPALRDPIPPYRVFEPHGLRISSLAQRGYPQSSGFLVSGIPQGSWMIRDLAGFLAGMPHVQSVIDWPDKVDHRISVMFHVPCDVIEGLDRILLYVTLWHNGKRTEDDAALQGV